MEKVQQPTKDHRENESSRKWTLSLSRIFETIIKRLTDIIVSAFGLIILLPVFAVVALIIKKDSEGPVFFSAHRVGWRGKLFKMLKFRTMYENTESYQGPPITANGDSRVTPFGRWLRETKLNELPQLWNVLIGEMSLVGPRPEVPDFVGQWPEDVRDKVLSVRPGITSPASIVYYNEEEILDRADFLDQYVKQIMPDKMRLDLLYLENRGFLIDLDVVLLTIFTISARLQNKPIKERTIFSGPLYLLFSQHISWFFADLLVAFGSVGIAGLAWRSVQTIELGFLNAILLALGIALLLSVVSAILGLHRIVWRYASPAMVFDIVISVFITVLIVVVFDRLLISGFSLPLDFILNFSLLMIFGMVLLRYRDRLVTGLSDRWLRQRSKRKTLGERVLIVGAGDGGEVAIWLLQKSEYAAAFSIVGFVDDDYRKQKGTMAGYPVLGVSRDIPALVEKHSIGLILFSISKIRPAERERILAICDKTGARIVEIPDMMRVIAKPAKAEKA
jgi:lipopolysaccharide/colanic/teichoic acid biosynthesis glycosyltransferase